MILMDFHSSFMNDFIIYMFCTKLEKTSLSTLFKQARGAATFKWLVCVIFEALHQKSIIFLKNGSLQIVQTPEIIIIEY